MASADLGLQFWGCLKQPLYISKFAVDYCVLCRHDFSLLEIDRAVDQLSSLELVIVLIVKISMKIHFVKEIFFINGIFCFIGHCTESVTGK